MVQIHTSVAQLVELPPVELVARVRFPPSEPFFRAAPTPTPDTPDSSGDPELLTGPPRLVRAAQQGAPDKRSRSCTLRRAVLLRSSETRPQTPVARKCHKNVTRTPGDRSGSIGSPLGAYHEKTWARLLRPGQNKAKLRDLGRSEPLEAVCGFE